MMQVNFSCELAGVWVLPTRTNEQTGRQAGTLISPLCTDSGCACCSLKSHIRRTWCFRFFQSREHFIFTFFRQTPVFLGENVRCKVKRFFWGYPPIRKNLSVVKWEGLIYGVKILFLPYPLIGEKNVRCKVKGNFSEQVPSFCPKLSVEIWEGIFFRVPPQSVKICPL